MVGTPEQEERREAVEKEQRAYAHVGERGKRLPFRRLTNAPSDQRPLPLPPWVSDSWVHFAADLSPPFPS